MSTPQHDELLTQCEILELGTLPPAKKHKSQISISVVFIGKIGSGGGGVLSEHPKKFSVVTVNQRFFKKPFCQCHWEIGGLGFC
jgi:hypothetical protein